jgi:biopolymer transport protein ExbD
MKLKRRRSNAFVALNITPLIDVVFQLLVFFMLSTNFARFRLIGVDSPQQRAVVATSEGAIVIQVGADGTLLFDNKPTPRAELTASVAAVVAIDPNRTFLIRPGEGVSLQEALAAYDEARAGGADALSFSRLRPEGAP